MRSFFAVFDSIINLINRSIFILVSLAVLGFMWGVVKVLFNPSNENLRKEGKAYMLYGIIALFVMVSVYGLVNLLATTLTIR
jgi:hypothetical protein